MNVKMNNIELYQFSLDQSLVFELATWGSRNITNASTIINFQEESIFTLTKMVKNANENITHIRMLWKWKRKTDVDKSIVLFCKKILAIKNL